MVNEEQWRDVPLDPWCDFFEVSNHGRVRFKPRIISDRDNSKGYRQVSLRYRGITKTFPVHRLVAMAFLDPPKDGQVVNHKNALRFDNNVENLEWCTTKENCNHAKNMGRLPSANSRSKIDIFELYELRQQGISYKKAAEKFGTTASVAHRMEQRAKANNNWPPTKSDNYRRGGDHPVGKIDSEACFQMHREGRSLKYIAKYFNTSLTAVSAMLKRAKTDGRFNNADD